ncbi:VTT domain-containing protein [Corynebacterium doosanense]|uniref:VTT domain-containing protein n=1 Tax=Corynebacterium doosanense TaxID=1121358 RepID=UPI000377B63D
MASPSRSTLTRLLLLALFAAAGVAVMTLFDVPPLSTLRDWADALGPWFVVAFWFAYVGVTQFPVPRTILTLLSGILLGPGTGILVALTATAVSAAVSLVVVRGLLADWIRPRLTHPAIGRINSRLRQRGWAPVISLRMIAGVPFSVMNYAAAMTDVRVSTFAAATFLGSAPGTIATVLFGDTLTGEADPLIVAITVALAVAGIIGLAVDSRLPVKPEA